MNPSSCCKELHPARRATCDFRSSRGMQVCLANTTTKICHFLTPWKRPGIHAYYIHVVYKTPAANTNWTLVYGQWVRNRHWRITRLWNRSDQRTFGLMEIRVSDHRNALLLLGHCDDNFPAWFSCYSTTALPAGKTASGRTVERQPDRYREQEYEAPTNLWSAYRLESLDVLLARSCESNHFPFVLECSTDEAMSL